MANDREETLRVPPPETNGAETDFESRYTFNTDLPPPGEWTEGYRTLPSRKQQGRAVSPLRPPPRPQPPPPPPPTTSPVLHAPLPSNSVNLSLSPSTFPTPPPAGVSSDVPHPSPISPVPSVPTTAPVPPRPSTSPIPPPPPPRTSSFLPSASQQIKNTESPATVADVQVSLTPTPPHSTPTPTPPHSTPSPPPTSTSSLSSVTHIHTTVPGSVADSASARPRSHSKEGSTNVNPVTATKRPRAGSRPKLAPPRRRPPPPPPEQSSTQTTSPASSSSTDDPANDSTIRIATYVNRPDSDAVQLGPVAIQPSARSVSPILPAEQVLVNSNTDRVSHPSESKQKSEASGSHKMTITDILSQCLEDIDAPLPTD